MVWLHLHDNIEKQTNNVELTCLVLLVKSDGVHALKSFTFWLYREGLTVLRRLIILVSLSQSEV